MEIITAQQLKSLPELGEQLGFGQYFTDHMFIMDYTKGIGWHEHDARLFAGTEQLFRPGYRANLVEAWLPADDDIDMLIKGHFRRDLPESERRVSDKASPASSDKPSPRYSIPLRPDAWRVVWYSSVSPKS